MNVRTPRSGSYDRCRVANLFKIEQNKTLLRDPNKVTRPEQSYETRTKLRDPNKTALAGCQHEAEASRAAHFGQGKTTQNSHGVQSRGLNRAERRSCGGMNSVLGNRRSSTVQSFRRWTIALAHRSTTQDCGTWCSSWIGVFFLTSESRSLQQGKTLTRSLRPGKIPIGIRSLSFHNVF
jgi:hypothetical protein